MCVYSSPLGNSVRVAHWAAAGGSPATNLAEAVLDTLLTEHMPAPTIARRGTA